VRLIGFSPSSRARPRGDWARHFVAPAASLCSARIQPSVSATDQVYPQRRRRWENSRAAHVRPRSHPVILFVPRRLPQFAKRGLGRRFRGQTADRRPLPGCLRRVRKTIRCKTVTYCFLFRRAMPSTTSRGSSLFTQYYVLDYNPTTKAFALSPRRPAGRLSPHPPTANPHNCGRTGGGSEGSRNILSRVLSIRPHRSGTTPRACQACSGRAEVRLTSSAISGTPIPPSIMPRAGPEGLSEYFTYCRLPAIKKNVIPLK
jgi:hypothetical protein